jgi:hypothetical protein
VRNFSGEPSVCLSYRRRSALLSAPLLGYQASKEVAVTVPLGVSVQIVGSWDRIAGSWDWIAGSWDWIAGSWD